MSSNPIATMSSRNYFSRTVILLCLCLSMLFGAAELVASDAFGLADVDLVAQKAERIGRLEASGVFTNDQILADFPDSVRESDAIGIKAGAGVVSLPTNVGKLFFADGLDPDESTSYELILIIDSLVVGGEVVLPDEMNLIGVQIDSSLLHSLLADNVLSLARRIPGSIPGETFTAWGPDGEVTYDLSMFYKVQYQPSRSVNDIKSELESLAILDEVYYIGIPIECNDNPEAELEPCPVNEPLLDDQWHLWPDSGIDATGAWKHICSDVLGDDGITIAIIDHDFGPAVHPDLENNIDSRSRFGMVPNIYFHGNNMAGACAASIGSFTAGQASKVDPSHTSGIGIAGVAPQAKLLLMDWEDGTDYMADIQYVVDSCPDVKAINFSWFVTAYSPDLEALLKKAYYKRGMLLVASIGESSNLATPPFIAYPSAYPNVIAVAASDTGRVAWRESNYGYVDVAAPGVDILTTHNPAAEVYPKPIFQYETVTGTSVACALTTGVAALMHSARPDLSPATVRRLMSEESYGVLKSYDERLGYGIINANEMVQKVEGGLYCEHIPGDANADCYVNDGDLTTLLENLFMGADPLPVPENYDVDGNCLLTIADLTYLVAYLWQGGPPPLPGCYSLDGGGLNTVVESDAVDEVVLHPNYPNPFNPSTTIAYTLPANAHVSVTIFNVLGREVTTLIDREQEAGIHEVVWNGTDASSNQVASGIYLYRIVAGDEVRTARMMLLK